MNRAYKVSFRDESGKTHSMRIEIGPDAKEPSPKDVEPLAVHYLSAYGQTLSGAITIKRNAKRGE